MLPPGRPPTVQLTPDSPSRLTADSVGLSPRHALSVHDCDGADREWIVESSVAKVSIFNSQNLTLRLHGRILTSTVEVFKCRNIRLVIGAAPDATGTLSEDTPTTQPLGTLQLDPPLQDVSIEYAAPEHIGKVIVAPLPTTDEQDRPTFGFRGLSLRAASREEPTVLFDAHGALHFPASSAAERPVTISPGIGGVEMARQLVVSHSDGRWQVTGLERGEKDYPVMA